MTAFQKPTQEQEEQPVSDMRGQLQRYAATPDNAPQPAPETRPFMTGAPGQAGAGASMSRLDNLPTGVLPSAPTPGQNGTSLSGLTQRPANSLHAPKTPLPANTGGGQNGNAAPPASNGRGQNGTSLSGPTQHPANQLFAPQTPRPNLPNEQGNGAPPVAHKSPQVPRQPQQPELQDGNLILHRSPNFFVRTTNRIGQRSDPLRKPSGHTTVMPKVMPRQNQRVAESETRLMPTVTPINPMKAGRFPVPAWLEALVIFIGMSVAVVAHAFNMFNYPRFELDEGTYMSNAWAILHGLITPDPYGYGHPPAAWMQLAGFVQVLGGFFGFGNALNTGRVIMLFYSAGSSLLVYLIVRRLGASRSAGLLALVIFSLSPLAIAYQRQVFLDNIATFWFLLSLFFLVVGNSRLLYIVLGAVCFGIALLSKEVFILFTPVMIYALWLHTTKFQRKFAVVAFTYVFVAVGSTFFLLAILKGELFPTGWLPWDKHAHLSLVQTFLDQGKRGQSEGSLASAWQSWTQGDLVLIILSIAGPVFNLLVGWWHRKQLLLALLAGSFWVLLVRGGVVLPFYIIPLIPLIAINTAMAVNTITNWIGKLVRFDLVRVVLILGVVAAIIPFDVMHSSDIFTLHPTTAQTDTMDWIRVHVPRNAFVVINAYLYMDMREPGGQAVGDGATYPNAYVYFNVAGEPEIHDTMLGKNNWDRIDYVIADSEMLSNIKSSGGGFDIIQQAINHSIPVARFSALDQGLTCAKPPGQVCTSASQLTQQQLVITVFQVQHKLPLPNLG